MKLIRGIVNLRTRVLGALAVGALVATSSLAILTAGAQAAESASSGAPINVGLVCSCTGFNAGVIVSGRKAYQAWVSSVNASGGINGHKINLIVKDDLGNPTNTIADVQGLVTQNHVVAMVLSTSNAAAVQSFLEAQKVPVVGSDGSTSPFISSPDFFFPGQTGDSTPTAFAIAAKQAGAKKAAVFYCAEVTTCAELSGPLKADAASYGVNLVYATAISASAPNYVAQCLAAKQAGATAILVADGDQQVESVAKSCSQQGYKPTIISEDGAIAKQFNTSPGLSNGFLGFEPVIPFIVTTTPGTKAMIKAFNKYQPGLVRDPNYSGETIGGWVSGLALGAALKSGGLTPSKAATSSLILKGLDSFNGTTLGGMSPPLTYTANKPNLTDCWFWLATKNGKWTTPYGVKASCVSDYKKVTS